MEVSEDIINLTDCKRRFVCLSDDKDVLCKVEEPICPTEPKLLFIKETMGNKDCNFQNPFGCGYLCICPVRIEIYKKYGI